MDHENKSEVQVLPILECGWIKECFEKLMKKAVEAYEEFRDRYGKVYLELKWVPDFNVPAAVILKTIMYYEEGNIERAEWLHRKYCLRVYTKEKVDEVLSIWKKIPELDKRIHILEQAVIAHQQGLYFVSVPVFCSQIEGYLADSSKDSGRIKQKVLIEVFGDMKRYHFFSELLQEFAKTILFAGFDRGSESSSTLSRNAILHGHDLEYGTKENSLKLLMLINLIQSLYLLATGGVDALWHRNVSDELEEGDMMYIDLREIVIPTDGQFFVRDAGQPLPFFEWEEAHFDQGYVRIDDSSVGFLTLTDTWDARISVSLKERVEDTAEAERVIRVPFEVKSGAVVVVDGYEYEGDDEGEEEEGVNKAVIELPNGHYDLHLVVMTEEPSDGSHEPVEKYEIVFVRK